MKFKKFDGFELFCFGFIYSFAFWFLWEFGKMYTN